MARITIEDCIEKVPNRFQLVRIAATRTKQLKKGARALLKVEDNKAVVTSLREIAAGLVRPGEADAEPGFAPSVPPGMAAPAPLAQSPTAEPVAAAAESGSEPEPEAAPATD